MRSSSWLTLVVPLFVSIRIGLGVHRRGEETAEKRGLADLSRDNLLTSVLRDFDDCLLCGLSHLCGVLLVLPPDRCASCGPRRTSRWTE